METAAPASKRSRTAAPSHALLRQGMDYREIANVQNLHAAIERQKCDARVTVKPFSLSALAIWGVAIFFAAFCSARYGTNRGSDRSDSPQFQPNPQTTQAAPNAVAVPSTVAESGAPPVVHIVIKNMKFEPATVELKAGDTVEWTNEDITAHTVTAVPSFDSGSIDADKSWRHTFTEPGNFSYNCTFHPDMKAAVTVK